MDTNSKSCKKAKPEPKKTKGENSVPRKMPYSAEEFDRLQAMIRSGSKSSSSEAVKSEEGDNYTLCGKGCSEKKEDQEEKKK